MTLGNVTTAALAALCCTTAFASPPKGDVDLTFSHRVEQPPRFQDKNIGNEVFYQIFIDRFANGNRANDALYDGRFSSPDQRDWYAFWAATCAASSTDCLTSRRSVSPSCG